MANISNLGVCLKPVYLSDYLYLFGKDDYKKYDPSCRKPKISLSSSWMFFLQAVMQCSTVADMEGG